MADVSANQNNPTAAAPQTPSPPPNSPDIPLPGAFKLFSPSWQAVQVNLVTFIELIIIPVMVSLVLTVLGRGRVARAPLSLISDLVAYLFAPAIIVTQLKSVRGEKIDLSQALKEGLKYFWKLLGLLICMGLLILGGLILLIVPGLIMIRRYYLAPYYLIDQDLSITEAMRQSAADSKPVSGAVWGVIGVSVLFGLLSLVLVGIVLSVMYYCASTLRYQQIAKNKKQPLSTPPAVVPPVVQA